MPQTRNYANLGQVTWRAEVGLADNSDPHARTVAEREFRSARSKGLAKAFVTAAIRNGLPVGAGCGPCDPLGLV